MTRSPSKLERVLFAVTASLALPYLILSIRLHLSNLRAVDAYSSVQVPEQHHWITENLAKHYQKSLSSSIRGGAGGAHSSGRDDGRERPEIAPSSSAPAAVAAAPSRALSLSLEAPFIFHGLKSLRPGREVVNEWLRQRREHLSRMGATFVGATSQGDRALQALAHASSVSSYSSLPSLSPPLSVPAAVPAAHMRSARPEPIVAHTTLTTPNLRRNEKTFAEKEEDRPLAVVDSFPGSFGAPEPRAASLKKDQARAETLTVLFARHPPSTAKSTANVSVAAPATTTTAVQAQAPVAAKALVKEGQVRARALLFTMDSMDQYVANSKRGGASGEITIRDALVSHLKTHLNVETDVATSDAHFERLANGDGSGGGSRGAGGLKASGKYAFAVLDAWTWAAPGWIPKAVLRGFEDRIFLLDFFGAKRPNRGGIRVPPSRILTAFPTYPGNTFLGYVIAPNELASSITATGSAARLPSQLRPPTTSPTWRGKKRPHGVIWGKDPKHYERRWGVISAIVEDGVVLHSTLPSSRGKVKHPNLVFHGHLSKEAWRGLLGSSMFMLGLGNPLLGPSAVDAVVAGCVYINPTYKTPVKDVYWSQHPYLADRVGAPHVCNANLDDSDQVRACVRRAVAAEVPPLIPKELTEAAYTARIEGIFGPYLPS